MAKSSWKSAEDEFEEHFESFGKKAYVHRLSDTAAAKAIAGKRAFTAAQPSDYIVTLEGEGMFYAEVKSTKDEKAFHFSNIRKGQLAACRRQIKAGGVYLFFIKNVLDQLWYCVPGEVVVQTNETKKHLTWVELEPFKYELL